MTDKIIRIDTAPYHSVLEACNWLENCPSFFCMDSDRDASLEPAYRELIECVIRNCDDELFTLGGVRITSTRFFVSIAISEDAIMTLLDAENQTWTIQPI